MTGFRHTSYFKYALIQVVSTVFNNIHVLLLPFWYYELTGSKLASGAIFVVESICSLLALPFIGVVIDRFSHRRITVITEVLRACAVAALLFVGASTPLSVVLIIAAFSSVGATTFFALQQAVIKINVSKEHVPQAQSLLSAVQGAALIAGPPLGAWLAGVVGYKPVFALNAASFIFSAASILFIRDAPLGHTSFRFGRDIREALIAAQADPQLWLLCLLQFVVYVAVGSLGLLFIFFFKDRGFSLQAISSMMGSMGVGILLGSALAARSSAQHLLSSSSMAVAMGALLCLLAALPTHSAVAAGAIMVAFGCAFASVGIFVRTSLQRHGAPDMMGRLASLLRLCMILGSGLSVWIVVGSSALLLPQTQLASLGLALLVGASAILWASIRHHGTDPRTVQSPPQVHDAPAATGAHFEEVES